MLNTFNINDEDIRDEDTRTTPADVTLVVLGTVSKFRF